MYNWLDEFEVSIANKAVGTPFEYPATKYEQSRKLTTSKGYKCEKNADVVEASYIYKVDEEINKGSS